MAIAVNSEGVSALKDYSAKLTDATDEIKTETDRMTNVTDQYSGKIGPHADQIKNALDVIKGAVFQGTVPAVEISDKLKEIAEAYQEIIDTIFYGGSGN